MYIFFLNDSKNVRLSYNVTIETQSFVECKLNSGIHFHKHTVMMVSVSKVFRNSFSTSLYPLDPGVSGTSFKREPFMSSQCAGRDTDVSSGQNTVENLAFRCQLIPQ